MRSFFIFQLVFSIFIVFSSNISHATESAPVEEAPYWSYDDDYTGQEDWGALKGYEICRYGFAQSPVNIGYAKTTKLPVLDFKYNSSAIITNVTDKSLTSMLVNGGSLIDGKKTYELKTIEIHSPSGHQIKSASYPIEIHLIHKDKENNTLIVAVFAEVKDENSGFQTIIDTLDIKNSGNLELDARSFIPENKGYYSYRGSLPYPPCTEGVEWRIMKQPITLDKKQMGEIVDKIVRNTRLTQPLYMREVLESE